MSQALSSSPDHARGKGLPATVGHETRASNQCRHRDFERWALQSGSQRDDVIYGSGMMWREHVAGDNTSVV